MAKDEGLEAYIKTIHIIEKELYVCNETCYDL